MKPNFQNMAARQKQSKSMQDKAIMEMLVREEWAKEKERVEQLIVANMFAASCLVLHDKFGFGKKRCNRFLGELQAQFELARDKFVSLEDFKNWSKEFLGV
jgi:hypothetical protein